MKTKTKRILMAVCAVVLVIASVAATVAYLTDDDSVTNTFTVGNVVITLDEADTDHDNNEQDNVTVNGVVRDRANKYHLIPGSEYTKDPTVHVDPKSEACYLFVKVENGLANLSGGTTIEAQMAAKGWVLVDGTTNISVYTENGAHAAVAGGSDKIVFEKIVISGNATNDDLAAYQNKNIVVTAYAIQASGFDGKTAAEIWTAGNFQ